MPARVISVLVHTSKRHVSVCAGLVESLLEVAFRRLALFLCASVMLFGATGAPRPVLKCCFGPVCSGSVRTGFPERRRKVLGEHGAVGPAAGWHPGAEGIWPLLPDGEIQIALPTWFCCTLPLALAAILLSVAWGSLPVFCDFVDCSFLNCLHFLRRKGAGSCFGGFIVRQGLGLPDLLFSSAVSPQFTCSASNVQGQITPSSVPSLFSLLQPLW